jgi:Raf kinase inhibitor-like YbhB/YbcL family protein
MPHMTSTVARPDGCWLRFSGATGFASVIPDRPGPRRSVRSSVSVRQSTGSASGTRSNDPTSVRRHDRGGTIRAAVIACSLLLSGCGRGDPPGLDDPNSLSIRLTSPAFADGAAIPKVYTCDGKDVAPPLGWTNVPASAKSLALLCDDPDAPLGTWTHWLVPYLSPEVKELPESPTAEQLTLAKARQGKNDFGKAGYGGPCPPMGTHHYVFRLFALDTELPADAGVSRKALLQAIQGHVLAEGKLIGTYGR